MKRILSICTAVLLSAASWSQTYNTGDKDFDASLKTVNIEASKDLSKFKLDISKTYGTTTSKVNSMFSIGMTAGDIWMSFEIGNLVRKPIDDVIVVYSRSKSKGWGAMAKELGIKPGSAEFHKLKGNCKNKSAKKSSGSSGGNGNGNGKSNGKSNGNGHSKKK